MAKKISLEEEKKKRDPETTLGVCELLGDGNYAIALQRFLEDEVQIGEYCILSVDDDLKKAYQKAVKDLKEIIEYMEGRCH